MSSTARPVVITVIIALVVGVVAAGVFAFSAFFPSSRSGESVARDVADAVVEDIAANSDNVATRTIDELVNDWIPADPVSVFPGIATVEPLAWSGQIGSDKEATIDIRVHASVEAQSTVTIGGDSWSAGETTVCYRLVWPRYYEAQVSTFKCPSGEAPQRPVVTPAPNLTEADAEAVGHALSAASDIEAFESELRVLYPDGEHTIEVVSVNGEMVVALGIPKSRDCLVLVRAATGEISRPSYDRILLEPGELGCSTRLYTNPPL